MTVRTPFLEHRELWYKGAILYSLDVKTFQDSDGDGVGDFQGLVARLDYLARLGITCLWLLPFYPSPNKDNGYDISDYYAVDPRLGSLGDFVHFMRRAQEYGIRVLVDLVVNHTSSEHPWFQAARSDEHSRYRDFYIWSKQKPEHVKQKVAFPGVQHNVWTYDPQAHAYYFHTFYKSQPDLNIANPQVRDEIMKIMGFWLQLGVSGFRVDAAPFLIEMKGVGQSGSDQYQYLEEFRQFLSWTKGDAILLAEANVSQDKIRQYFGDGHRMHMVFNFILNQHVFLALARESANPLVSGLKELPSLPATGQWANFLRNHDELTLDRLTKAERQDVFDAFGMDAEMQIYKRGLRRRLAPMLNGDRHRIAMALSLLFSLPGTPVLRYGEAIGMGEDLSLPERNSVRTPMQWSDEKNGGFSSALTKELVRPVIHHGRFGYARVNVTFQRRHSGSLLSLTEKLIRVRKECPEFGFGKFHLISTQDDGVFAHSCEWYGGTVVAVHNFANRKVRIELDFGREESHLVDLLGDYEYEPLDSGSKTVELEPYGFRWFRLFANDHDETGEG